MFGLWGLTVKRHKKNLPSPQTYLQETKDIIILRGTTLIYEQCHTPVSYTHLFSLSASSTAAWIPTYSPPWTAAVIRTVFPG